MDELEHCGPKAYDSFVKALEETRQTPAVEDLSEALRQLETSSIALSLDGNILFEILLIFTHTAGLMALAAELIVLAWK